jgi:predicted metalloprotease with PDZ domain
MRFASLFLVALCVTSALFGQIGLEYRVEYTPQHQLYVTMSWQAEGNHLTNLHFIPLNGNQTAIPWHKNFTCLVPTNQVRHFSNSTSLQVTHQDNQIVSCSYLVSPDTHLKQFASEATWPTQEKEYFHVLGNYLFASIEGYKQQTAKITWVGFPENWKICNSYGQNKRTQVILVNNDAWREAVFAGGVAEVKTLPLKNGIVSTYVFGGLGHVQFLANEVASALMNERTYWDEESTLTYLAIFIPLKTDNAPNSLKMTGMGVKNAFSALLNASSFVDTLDLRHLIYHELMHEWIGQKLKMKPDVMMQDERWFMEGFTEYFAHLVQLENQVMTKQVFCEIANQTFFTPYFTQKPILARKRLNPHSLDYSQIDFQPYRVGFVYAWYLDEWLHCNTLKATTLKNIMIDLMDRSIGHDGQRTEELLLSLLVQHLGKEIVPIHQAVVQKGSQISMTDFHNCHPDWSLSVEGKGPTIVLKGK